MSRNGSGTYTLPAGNPVVSGTTITTSWANTTLTDIASSLTGSVAADGQTPMTGALNMANNKVSAVTDPTLAQDAATKAYADSLIAGTKSGLFTSVTDSGLTATRVTYATTAGLLTDSANMTFDGTTITSSFSGAHNGTVGATTPSTVKATGLTVTGATSGTLAIAATAVAGTNTATFPAATGTVMVSGNMPAFSVYLSANQNITTSTLTKITFDIEEFDTNNNFASNRFTPTVAGYYQINALMVGNGTYTRGIVSIYKNGSEFRRGVDLLTAGYAFNVSSLIYCNGSTDYIEIYGFLTGTGISFNSGATAGCYFNGSLVRSA